MIVHIGRTSPEAQWVVLPEGDEEHARAAQWEVKTLIDIDSPMYIAGLLDEHEFMQQQPPHSGIKVYGPYPSCLEAVEKARTLSTDPDEAVVIQLEPKGST